MSEHNEHIEPRSRSIIDMDVTPDVNEKEAQMILYIVVSTFVLSGITYFNTWPFTSREKAEAFIESGKPDEATDLDHFEDRKDAYKIREEILDPK